MSFKCTTEMDALRAVEQALGNNLVWLADELDLSVRQGDTDAIRRLNELNTAWVFVCKVIHAAEKARLIDQDSEIARLRAERAERDALLAALKKIARFGGSH